LEKVQKELKSLKSLKEGKESKYLENMKESVAMSDHRRTISQRKDEWSKFSEENS
jgi:hypothetical protein